jgi:hypothetical protein
MTSTKNPGKESNKTMLLSFKFLDNTRGDDKDNLMYMMRDLLISPKFETEDHTPFSFAFSGLHDGGAMPLPHPSLDEKDRLVAHNFYGHLVDVLKEGKSTIDNKITALNSQLQKEGDEIVPVSKKAKISKEKEEDNEEEEEEKEEEEAEKEEEEEQDK